jgi:hypothetical protein
MKRVLSVLSLLLVAGAKATAADYYVAPAGDDRNPGTLDQPFATIQCAVNKLTSGGTCYIREGVYRETVDLSGKAGSEKIPITLISYNGEKVTLDGTLKIDGEWTLDEGQVYKTKVSEDVTQLFVDGKLMTLARFPNALAFSAEVWHRNNTRCLKSRESTNGHVVDGGTDARSIAAAGVSFNGCVALLNFGAHATGTRLVENHKAGSNAFDYAPELMKYKTTTGYFLEGGAGSAERVMLDMAQEWAYDESTQTLYLWADNGLNPAGREIFGKNRTFAITGDAATKHVIVDGLDFFASTFSFNKSDNITIRNCDFNYYASSKRALGVLGPSDTANFTGDAEDFCSNITVYNCEFRRADASALLGDFVENFVIENNLFHEIDYACANNDTGRGQPFSPSSTIRLNKCLDVVYRRNTLSVNGNAQGFSINRYLGERPPKRFSKDRYEPETTRNFICEYNFHTACGLLHTDGASLYSPDMHIMESVSRYNWFIGNGQRDFRWDGKNKPLLGVHANLYRNVALDTGVKKMSPSGGNGFRVKGSYHEVYNNLGVGRGAELNIATEKGGNAETVTRNNAASHFTDKPIPGISSNNYAYNKNIRRVQELLRDPANWDFRPKADAVELIDQGTPVTCSIQGVNVDVTAGFNGKAPDIGAYEFGDEVYWIPGRQAAQASMPVPQDGGEQVPLDADLMFLIGLGGDAAGIYLGVSPDELTGISALHAPKNIVALSGTYVLSEGKTYYWRVDTRRKDGSVIKGAVWSFTTASADQ